MKVKWLGHASFLLTSDSGVRIVTDPYTPAENLKYGNIEEAADIVTTSHEHHDHNNAAAVKGNPKVLKGSGEARGIKIKGMSVHHDDSGGSQRGNNTIFCFAIDGMNVCHLGDLGHLLSDKQAAELGKVDVLLVPVGGFFTIDAGAATKTCDQIKPKVIIPMHYKNEKCDFPIAIVDDFLSGKKNVKRMNASEVDIKAGALPAQTEVWVLKPAL